jgi:hypothetical protein
MMMSDAESPTTRARDGSTPSREAASIAASGAGFGRGPSSPQTAASRY